jgi:excisionase family DNA binding protein
MSENQPDILTIEEAASLLRIPLSSMYRLAQEGRIPAQKVGRHWRFHSQTLIQWIAKGQVSFDAPSAKPEKLDFS